LPGLTALAQSLIEIRLGLIEPIRECDRFFVTPLPEIVEQHPYQLASALDFLSIRRTVGESRDLSFLASLYVCWDGLIFHLDSGGGFIVHLNDSGDVFHLNSSDIFHLNSGDAHIFRRNGGGGFIIGLNSGADFIFRLNGGGSIIGLNSGGGFIFRLNSGGGLNFHHCIFRYRAFDTAFIRDVRWRDCWSQGIFTWPLEGRADCRDPPRQRSHAAPSSFARR